QPSVSVVSTAATLSDTAAGSVFGPASVSKDGRYVVYTDNAANLSPSESMNPLAPIIQSNSSPGVISEENVYLYDRSSGKTTLVSHAASGTKLTANGMSENPVISADGHYLTYVSTGSKLVSGQESSSSASGVTNTPANVFVYDRTTDTNFLISATAGGDTNSGGAAITPGNDTNFSAAIDQNGDT